MDKKTLSHYGWIVISALIIAVMLSFTTPFGEFVMDGASSIASGYINVTNKALEDEHQNKIVDKWSEKWSDEKPSLNPKNFVDKSFIPVSSNSSLFAASSTTSSINLNILFAPAKAIIMLFNC